MGYKESIGGKGGREEEAKPYDTEHVMIGNRKKEWYRV